MRSESPSPPEPDDGREAKSACTVLVASNNRGKVEEIRAALRDWISFPLRVVGLEILPPGATVEETGSTFEENAVLKARGYATMAAQLPEDARPHWILADDSGLCVDALGGAPGVRSARYAGPAATDAENNRKLLEALRGVPPGSRGAEFVCVIACLRLDLRPSQRVRPPGPELFVVQGRARGEILEAPRGTGGFGYDPLFFCPEAGKTFAELSTEEKARFSHRGKALRAFSERFQEECGRKTA